MSPIQEGARDAANAFGSGYFKVDEAMFYGPGDQIWSAGGVKWVSTGEAVLAQAKIIGICKANKECSAADFVPYDLALAWRLTACLPVTAKPYFDTVSRERVIETPQWARWLGQVAHCHLTGYAAEWASQLKIGQWVRLQGLVVRVETETLEMTSVKELPHCYPLWVETLEPLK